MKRRKTDGDRGAGRSGGLRLWGPVVAGLALLLVGWSAWARPGAGLPPRGGLANAYESKEALAQAVLAALRASDREALEALRVTEEEYRSILWPELPEYGSKPFTFYWSFTDVRSRKAARRVVEDWGGQELELVSLEFMEEPERYATYTLHLGARLTVRRLSDGAVGRLSVVDVFLERGGWWKLLDIDDD